MTPNSLPNATGAQAIAIAKLAEMVASALAFQESANVNSTEDALAYVHYPYYRVENQQVQKPFAVVYEDTFKRMRLADGVMMGSGTLNLMLGTSMADTDDSGEAGDTEFNNWQDNVLLAVSDLAQVAGNLHIVNIEQKVPSTRSSPEHVAGVGAQMPFWFSEYAVSWNPLG